MQNPRPHCCARHREHSARDQPGSEAEAGLIGHSVSLPATAGQHLDPRRSEPADCHPEGWRPPRAGQHWRWRWPHCPAPPKQVGTLGVSGRPAPPRPLAAGSAGAPQQVSGILTPPPLSRNLLSRLRHPLRQPAPAGRRAFLLRGLQCRVADPGPQGRRGRAVRQRPGQWECRWLGARQTSPGSGQACRSCWQPRQQAHPPPPPLNPAPPPPPPPCSAWASRWGACGPSTAACPLAQTSTTRRSSSTWTTSSPPRPSTTSSWSWRWATCGTPTYALRHCWQLLSARSLLAEPESAAYFSRPGPLVLTTAPYLPPLQMAPEDFLRWATGSAGGWQAGGRGVAGRRLGPCVPPPLHARWLTWPRSCMLASPDPRLYLPPAAAGGKTILDFYNDAATKALFKRHMATILNRWAGASMCRWPLCCSPWARSAACSVHALSSSHARRSSVEFCWPSARGGLSVPSMARGEALTALSHGLLPAGRTPSLAWPTSRTPQSWAGTSSTSRGARVGGRPGRAAGPELPTSCSPALARSAALSVHSVTGQVSVSLRRSACPALLQAAWTASWAGCPRCPASSRASRRSSWS